MNHLNFFSAPVSCAQRFAPRSLAFAFAAFTLLALLVPGTAFAERAVTLAWDRSADPATIGYYIYALEEFAASPVRINALGLTQVTVPNLKEGVRYSFKVTAYNAAGLESAPSNEAGYVVPVVLRLLPGSTTGAAKRLQFPMARGHWYELQASTNLTTWTTIWQTPTANAYEWTEFQDTNSATTVSPKKGTNFKSRFYRLKIH